MLDGVGVPLVVDVGEAVANLGQVRPVVLVEVCAAVDLEAAVPLPGVEHPALGPGGGFFGDVQAVVLRGIRLVAHAAAESEVVQRAAAQLAVEVVLVVPAEPAVLQAGIDEGIAHPAREVRVVDARDARRGLVGGVGKPARLFLRILFPPNVGGQQLQQVLRERCAPLHDHGTGRIGRRRGAAGRHREGGKQQEGEGAEGHAGRYTILPPPRQATALA